MSIRHYVDEELRRISAHQEFGEDAAPDGELDTLNRIDTAEALSLVEAYGRAVKQLREWLRAHLAEEIQKDGKNFMYGNTLYRVGPKREWVIDDLDDLVRLLGDDVPRAFRLDVYNLRTDTLKAIARERDIGDTLDAMVYKRDTGELDMTTPPMKRWPKFLRDMVDGEVR